MGDSASETVFAVAGVVVVLVVDDAVPFGAAASFAAPFTGIPVFKGQHPYTLIV